MAAAQSGGYAIAMAGHVGKYYSRCFTLSDCMAAVA
jgi:hypothetical protein